VNEFPSISRFHSRGGRGSGPAKELTTQRSPS
jgi:hypothetical protein